MKLKELMNVLTDGVACFSILPYCEEYREGLDRLKEESWYTEIKDRNVKCIVTIGGGMYDVETCIELEEN
ncbi:hypothetical protein SAMN05443270_0010 [Lacrimispora sphenoides]|uniref:hypothetical protein n=1 Tax=Lacrimispora sphenoides TaxID=29370 RepID=UPI0008B87757|nr:hypothetical protein [Lacrimispora sphenoides]SET42698.1 hypothetical protein SAMN05443270_0010 [Lacrimispora sphenoides]